MQQLPFSDQKFNKFMERLCATNLKLQPDKYEFVRTKVTYLGHLRGSPYPELSKNRFFFLFQSMDIL